MKKLTKIMSIVMIVLMTLSCLSTVFAAEANNPTVYNPAGWKSGHNTSAIDATQIGDFSASVINVVSVVGSAAAIVTLIILGVKYMMGSAEEKAEYKKTLLPYIIGAAMVFGASVLVGVIYNFMNSGG